jgi:excisionase family DNA binding protein
VSAPSRAEEITAVARQLAAAAAAARDTALQAATTQPCIRLALAILRDAPDLADALSAGQLDLTSAHRALNAHQHPAQDALSITCLTVPEVAALLRVSRSTVYRLIKEEQLQAVKAGPRSVRIPEPSVCGYLVTHAIAAVKRLGKLSAPPAGRAPARMPAPASGTSPDSPRRTQKTRRERHACRMTEIDSSPLATPRPAAAPDEQQAEAQLAALTAPLV